MDEEIEPLNKIEAMILEEGQKIEDLETGLLLGRLDEQEAKKKIRQCNETLRKADKQMKEILKLMK